MEKEKYNKDTKLEEVINFGETLSQFGVPCITCPFAKQEMDKLSLGDISHMYGVDLDGLLKALNKKASGK